MKQFVPYNIILFIYTNLLQAANEGIRYEFLKQNIPLFENIKFCFFIFKFTNSIEAYIPNNN